MKQFLQTLETAPESITFNATIAVIDAHYELPSPTPFPLTMQFEVATFKLQIC